LTLKRNFRIIEGSLAERFFASRAKVQILGGGFANGKTANAVIRALNFAKDYPGSNGLIARSTYPKLNDTIRKEFLKWCPKHWITSFPMSQNASNTCTLSNGTEINFRYIAQQGKQKAEQTTSNLLSATYDWVVVDQMEDPEIVHKDFLDLLGRLRGMARYEGEDPTMPSTGPRVFVFTTNPTANWVYQKVVKPYHDYLKGMFNPDLLCETDKDGKPIFTDGKPSPIVEIHEGSTYENKENLEEDFIKTLEATYKGQMRDRFLLGKWASYEGLVYPDFDLDMHVIAHSICESYFWELARSGRQLEIVEGYDWGIASPSCYLFSFIDGNGNIFLLDGFYEKEMNIDEQATRIQQIREYYGGLHSGRITADPDIFRRKGVNKKTVGQSIADMFMENGVYCERGNNDIGNGIVKINQYLYPQRNHIHPLTHNTFAPYLYTSDRLEFLINEITGYFWRRDQSGGIIDKPQDRDDHAMDALRYMVSKRPAISKLLVKEQKPMVVGSYRWAETAEEAARPNSHRYV